MGSEGEAFEGGVIRVGEMFEGFADAIRGREREEDVGTAVVGGGR